MRRIDIVNSITNIQEAVESSKVFPAVADLVRKEEKSPVDVILDAMSTYSYYYRNFTDTEKEVVKILNLGGLEDPKIWANIFGATGVEKRSSFVKYYNALTFLRESLPKLLLLFKQDNITYNNVDNQIVSIYSENTNHSEVITVIIPEKDKTVASNPERLIKVLSSINAFYDVLSNIMGHQGNDLSVIAIDSGSDKSFDFLGAAKVVTAVKELVIGLWDRVVYYREKKLEERIELISKTIPLIENINTLEKDKKISSEQAELFRRSVLGGAKDFLLAGAVLPEFVVHATYNPRQLMAPERKLLSMPNNVKDEPTKIVSEVLEEADNDDDNDDEIDFDNLSTEQKELFKALLSRKPRKKKK